MTESQPLPPLVQASSGAFGAITSNALVYPLDLIGKRMQTQGKRGGYSSLPAAFQAIIKDEGLVGFYKGLGSDTLSTCLSNLTFFWAYAFLRDRLTARKSARGAEAQFTALEELAIGSLAGVVSRAIITPLSQITVRQQTAADPKESQKATEEAGDDASEDEDGGYSRGPSMLQVAKQIHHERGLTGFWAGFQSACILTLNPSITLYLFELFKRLTIPSRYRDKPTAVQTFLASSIASSVAAAVTYPLMLAKTRQQWRSPTGRQVYSGMADVFRKTLRRSGPRGLFAGLTAQIVKSFLQLGITMTIKQRVELLIVLTYRSAQKRSLRQGRSVS